MKYHTAGKLFAGRAPLSLPRCVIARRARIAPIINMMVAT